MTPAPKRGSRSRPSTIALEESGTTPPRPIPLLPQSPHSPRTYSLFLFGYPRTCLSLLPTILPPPSPSHKSANLSGI